MDLSFGRVQFLQAQLFPVCTITAADANERGFLGSFLSKSLKTNQLEVNTDEKTLRSIARLKEPRDLFALPKDKDNDCPQQAPRWPIECQVIEERVVHIQSVPAQPEPYNQPTGNELKPRPVGEENGIVVFSYNPISAVNYEKPVKFKAPGDDSSDSDSSSDSSPEYSTPDRRKMRMQNSFVKMLDHMRHSSSNSDDEVYREFDDVDEDDDEDEDTTTNTPRNGGEHIGDASVTSNSNKNAEGDCDGNDIDDIWAYKSPEYNGTPNFIKRQFGKEVPKNKTGQQKSTPPPPISKATFHNPVSAKSTLHAKRLEGGANQTIEKKASSSSLSSLESTDSDADDQCMFPEDRNSTKKAMTQTITETKTENRSFILRTKAIEYARTQETIRKLKINFNNNNNNNNQKDTNSNQDAININNLDFNNLDGDFKKCVQTLSSSCYASKPTVPPLPQFSRSAVGGSKFLSNCHPQAEDYDGLEFESRFESGNLAKAVMITQTYYELYLRPDLYTSRSKQWFYFRVRKTKKNLVYRFSIVNLVKSDSLYNEGMRPLMYSTINAKQVQQGWRRCGQNIVYYRNDDESSTDDDDDNSSYTLTWNIEFPHDNDTVYFAHSYPYTYSDLQDYLMEIQKHPVKSKFCKLRLLCRSLAGNNVYYLTVTAPTADEEAIKRKKAVVVSARVHPSETPSSWMMKGLMDFITGDTSVAKRLRHRFIFKLIPMLNPDGVIVGNTRNSLTGKDLNRQYRTVIRETYPSIWYTKAMIKRLIDECGVTMYCDMHAHSRKHNIFIYGCENRRNPDKKLTEQVFPLMMHKNVADKFSFEDCKFKIQRSKEGTGRIVVWMLGITNSYTIEASFGGSSLGSRKSTHFNTADYEHIGRAFCETLLDFCDENPNKVKKAIKTFKQIKKMRKRERREKKALKIKKLAEQGCIIDEKLKERLRLKIIERLLKEGSSAEEPLNIPLSDYSSDEGDTSSSSDNEGKASLTLSDLEGPCCAPLRAPPCSPEINPEIRKFMQKRMRKVMQELDRIYFQPLFKKKFRALIKSRRIKLKPQPQSTQKRTERIGDSKRNLGASSKKSIKNQEPDQLSLKSLERTAAAEKRSQYDNSAMNTPEAMRIAAGLDKVPRKIHRKKKTVTTTTEENDDGTFVIEKPCPRRLRVSRKFRLWLEKRQIIIYRKVKKSKSKIRSKSWQIRNRPTRLAFDMPTTDPGSDLVFSTDDEFYAEISETNNTHIEGYGTVPRARRLLQSELQRRYIEEFGGDRFNQIKRMPPELIVTSPTKQNLISNEKQPPATYPFPFKAMHPLLPSTSPAQPEKTGLLSEFPIIGAPIARRTSSWHNINNSNSKSAPKVRNLNPYMPAPDNTNRDDLQFRLSLKKKIWTGVQPDGANSQNNTRSRPLSWGLPPVNATAKNEKTNILTRFSKKDDKEALFNACSQKLIAWQQQNLSMPVVNQTGTGTATYTKSKGKFTMNQQLSESTEDEKALVASSRVRQDELCANSRQHTSVLVNKSITQKTMMKTAEFLNATTESKAKKRKNPMSKLADTTQLITRLAKTKSHTTIAANNIQHRRLKSANTSNSTLHSNSKSSNQNSNKFKTGGLVATATAQPKKHKKRSLAVLESRSSVQMDNLSTSKISNRTLGVITIDMQAPSTESANPFVRKVKTKLRRKSKSQASSTASVRKAN